MTSKKHIGIVAAFILVVLVSTLQTANGEALTTAETPRLIDANSLNLLWDISITLAIAATALLLASELLSPYYGRTSLRINKENLQKVGFVFTVLFAFTIFIRVLFILLKIA